MQRATRVSGPTMYSLLVVALGKAKIIRSVTRVLPYFQSFLASTRLPEDKGCTAVIDSLAAKN